jgi:hypothetical protein
VNWRLRDEVAPDVYTPKDLAEQILWRHDAFLGLHGGDFEHDDELHN